MKAGNSRLSLFLIEIIAAILVFAICSAVCISIFASARQKSDDSSARNFASIAATSAAEALKGCGFDCGDAARAIGGSAQGDTLTVYYDDDWTPVQTGASYTLTATVTTSGTLARAAISVSGDEPVFTLDVAGFIGGAA